MMASINFFFFLVVYLYWIIEKKNILLEFSIKYAADSHNLMIPKVNLVHMMYSLNGWMWSEVEIDG